MVIVHRPLCCGGCGGDLGPDAPQVGQVLRQVFDLPAEISVVVTEHQLVKLACACGRATSAAAPAEAAGPTSIGAGIGAVAVYLAAVQMIPVSRVAATIEALFGISGACQMVCVSGEV